MPCIVCSSAIAQQIGSGFATTFPVSESKPKVFLHDGNIVDACCPDCDSRSRLRAITTLLTRSENFIRAEDRIFLVSASKPERKVYGRYWRHFQHVSLFADWHDKDCRTGVDITCMPEIPDSTYDVAIALCVLDYIPQAELAIREIGRILKPGGVFFFFIQPQRIRPTPKGMPIVKMVNSSDYSDPPSAYGSFPIDSNGINDRKTPVCVFDPVAIPLWIEWAGLKPGIFRIRDELADFFVTIYSAKKV